MDVERYQPEVHEPWLATVCAMCGWPFLRPIFSDTGFVAKDSDGRFVACVFLYRDPSCQVVFADNVIATPAAAPGNAFRVMAAMRALWRAVAAACQECLVVVQTDSPFVMATLRRDKCLAAPMTSYRVTAPFFGKGV